MGVKEMGMQTVAQGCIQIGLPIRIKTGMHAGTAEQLERALEYN